MCISETIYKLKVSLSIWGEGGMGHRPLRLRDEAKTAVTKTKKNAAAPPIICESTPPPPRPGLGYSQEHCYLVISVI